MLFGNRSFTSYQANPLPDINAFLEHTFNNDNFMFDLLMESSYEENGNIILSEASIGDFIGKFFKAIKDAIVKFIKMIKDFITGAVSKLKSLFSKKKKEVEEKKKEIEEKKEEKKEKEEKLPTSAAQVAAGGAVGAALAAAKTVEKKNTSAPKTSSTKPSSTSASKTTTTPKTTSTVASKPQSVTSNTKTPVGSGFSPAARKSAKKATQTKPINNKPVTSTASKSATEKSKASDVVVTNNNIKVLYNLKYISYGSLCQDFIKLLGWTTMDSEVFDILNLPDDAKYAKESNYRFSTLDSSRTNRQLANSSVKRDDISLNYNDDDKKEGYLFISNYEKKIEEIKQKQETMYPDIIFGTDLNKYKFISSYFTKNTNGTTFRQDVQKFGSIQDKDLSNDYSYDIDKLDTKELNSIYNLETNILEECTQNFNRWKTTIEKSLNAIVKNLENMEKQINKDVSGSDNVNVAYTNTNMTNRDIKAYNNRFSKGKFKIYDNEDFKDLEDEIKSDQKTTTVPRKPLLDYLNTTKTFINDLLSSVSSLANNCPRLIAKGSNYIFGFNLQYFSLLF